MFSYVNCFNRFNLFDKFVVKNSPCTNSVGRHDTMKTTCQMWQLGSRCPWRHELVGDVSWTLVSCSSSTCARRRRRQRLRCATPSSRRYTRPSGLSAAAAAAAAPSLRVSDAAGIIITSTSAPQFSITLLKMHTFYTAIWSQLGVGLA